MPESGSVAQALDSLPSRGRGLVLSFPGYNARSRYFCIQLDAAAFGLVCRNNNDRYMRVLKYFCIFGLKLAKHLTDSKTPTHLAPCLFAFPFSFPNPSPYPPMALDSLAFPQLVNSHVCNFARLPHFASTARGGAMPPNSSARSPAIYNFRCFSSVIWRKLRAPSGYQPTRPSSHSI